MARPLRIELPGGLYHVTARGDRREAILFGNDDRDAWLELLGGCPRNLLETARYVMLNPTRAAMVSDTGHWPWSSYHAMVGEAPCPSWLERDWLLGQFAKRRATAIRRYADFVRAGVGLPPLWNALHGQVFLGSEAFAERMRARLPDTDCARARAPRSGARLRRWPRYSSRSIAAPAWSPRIAPALTR